LARRTDVLAIEFTRKILEESFIALPIARLAVNEGCVGRVRFTCRTRDIADPFCDAVSHGKFAKSALFMIVLRILLLHVYGRPACYETVFNCLTNIASWLWHSTSILLMTKHVVDIKRSRNRQGNELAHLSVIIPGRERSYEVYDMKVRWILAHSDDCGGAHTK